MDNKEFNDSSALENQLTKTPKPRKNEYCEGSQYTFDDLYVTPFKQKRVYDPDGNISYVPIERNLHPTGIDVLDEFLLGMSSGEMGTYKKYGFSTHNIHNILFVLTGIQGVQFVNKWRVKVAMDLLRYTDLAMPEVANYSAMGTTSNLFYFMQREAKTSPLRYRYWVREKGDLGRFKL